MKGNFFKQLTKKIIKFIICVLIVININSVGSWLSKVWAPLYAITFLLFGFCIISAIECITNIIHYIKIVKKYGFSEEVEDTYRILDSDSTSTGEGMFHPNGTLTFRGKTAFNDMCRQRDIYNRTSTHNYMNKK